MIKRHLVSAVRGRRFILSLACVVGAGACAAETSPGDGPSLRRESAQLQAASSATCDPTVSGFYAPPPPRAAVLQTFGLLRQRRFAEAGLVASLATTPRAVWFTQGTPDEVRDAVRSTVHAAAAQHRVPVLVAYNVPYRDCAQYSAGGAADTAAYQAWIQGFAAGLGEGKAEIILEPDGLGIIPNNTTIYGAAEWCHPTVTDAAGNSLPAPGATPAERYAQINYAVDTIAAAAPGASVYLDGTHSAWLGVGESAYRLAHAGIARAQGFFVNVSNNQPTDQSTLYGTWVSQCLTAATAGAPWAAGHFEWCPSQYNAATGFTVDYSDAYAATVTAGLASMLGGAVATTKFVIDTGRNGQGAWTPGPLATYPDPQVWCNAPGRGVGFLPSVDTGHPLVAAYLWVKIPGESDGSCNRGVAGATVDPEWGGMVDPAAGVWFPEQALQLAKLGVPPLF